MSDKYVSFQASLKSSNNKTTYDTSGNEGVLLRYKAWVEQVYLPPVVVKKYMIILRIQLERDLQLQLTENFGV